MGEDMEEEKQLEGTRTGGMEHEVQRCKSERSSCAKVQKWEATFRVAGGGQDIFGSQVSADRVSGTGCQVRVRVRVLNLYLVLNT